MTSELICPRLLEVLPCRAEEASCDEDTWSVMSRSGAHDFSSRGAVIERVAFSIEEVSTVDFEQIPSVQSGKDIEVE